MSESGKSQFVYVTYIRTTQEKLWEALTQPGIIKKFWFGINAESTFKAGSPWKIAFDDGKVADMGEILESDPPKRLVIKWLHQWKEELKAEGEALCTMTLEPAQGAVKLTIDHSINRPESKLIKAVSGGWPMILSNLKTLLETGSVAMERMN